MIRKIIENLQKHKFFLLLKSNSKKSQGLGLNLIEYFYLVIYLLSLPSCLNIGRLFENNNRKIKLP